MLLPLDAAAPAPGQGRREQQVTGNDGDDGDAVDYDYYGDYCVSQVGDCGGIGSKWFFKASFD